MSMDVLLLTKMRCRLGVDLARNGTERVFTSIFIFVHFLDNKHNTPAHTQG